LGEEAQSVLYYIQSYYTSKMNVIQAVQDYITKMITNIQGMKVLLLDKDTVGIVSIVYSRSQILQKEVFLHERIDVQGRQPMAHLKAVCFLRPTQENLSFLQDELKEAKYGEYHLFFSNTLKNSYIEDLAQADTHEVVQQVQEFFADYYAVNPDTFTLNLDKPMVSAQQSDWRALSGRTVDCLASILLSLKKQPFIRYSGRSAAAKKVVDELDAKIRSEPGLFDFKKLDTPPLLLVLDRADDPITPLLTQWTYQAMVHQQYGLRNNIVSLDKHVANIKKELKEIILSCEQDPFFKQTMYANFGELGAKIKDLVDEFQAKSKGHQNIESIEDIKKFINEFPEFKKMSGNVSKHVTLMSELSSLVDQRALLQLSELEQELANNESHSDQVENIRMIFNNPKVIPEDLVKIVMLYALRYEGQANALQSFMDELATRVDADMLSRVNLLLQYAGNNARSGDLFGRRNLIAKKMASIRRGIKGVENLYTEHKPQLKSTIEAILTNKLSTADYPFMVGSPTRDVPQDIIVFFVGGATFEEALTIHQFNTNGSGVRIVLGGTTIHNSKTFLNDVASLKDLNYR